MTNKVIKLTESELLATIKCDLNGCAISNLYSTSGQTITLNTPTKENSEFLDWKKSGPPVLL